MRSTMTRPTPIELPELRTGGVQKYDCPCGRTFLTPVGFHMHSCDVHEPATEKLYTMMVGPRA